MGGGGGGGGRKREDWSWDRSLEWFHAHVHSSNHAPFLMHMRIDAMKVAAAVLMASNCRETVSLFANCTSSKGVSMEALWIRHWEGGGEKGVWREKKEGLED